MMSLAAALLLFAQAAPPPPAESQQSSGPRAEVVGQVSVQADVLPRRDVTELRPQISAEATLRPSSAIRLKFDGFVEGLAADRSGRVIDGIARVREAWFELAGSKSDLRVGYGRLAWGRLDEVQPSDVINPLDTSRFLFEGRSVARRPVGFVRGRFFPTESFTVEAVLVPRFTAGAFDELDEDSSPFNLSRDIALTNMTSGPAPPVFEQDAPGWGEWSGGGRVLATVGRVDVAAGAYRGFEGFRIIDFHSSMAGALETRFPRFTMVSADFETVTGEWVWRGELAAFVDKTLQRPGGVGAVKGNAIDGGVGFDRRTGDYRVFASTIIHREWSAEDPAVNRTDVSVIGSIERQLSRDRYLVRAFAVINPADASGFIRGLIMWRAADNVAIEGSAAAFLGRGDDAIARFRTRDFLLTRIRWRF